MTLAPNLDALIAELRERAKWARLGNPTYASLFDRAADALSTARAQGEEEMLAWAVERWFAEVANRPLKNIHRRTLDDTWRQVMRHCGGDPVELCGPAHDDLLSAPEATS